MKLRDLKGSLARCSKTADMQGDLDTALMELASMKWCPVMAEAPEAGLPWPKAAQRFASPSTSRPAGDLWLASSSMTILQSFPSRYCCQQKQLTDRLTCAACSPSPKHLGQSYCDQNIAAFSVG